MRRLAFYCHNVLGLGHIVRSLKIASAANAMADCECTVITGCRSLDALPRDGALRIARLPPVRLVDSRFVADDASLRGVDALALRGQLILDHCRRLAPHALLVDHNPFGLGGELRPALAAALDERWPTRFIWGVPYAEGGPAGAAPRNPALLRAVRHYHSAIGYTDPDELDVLSTVAGWALPARSAHVGYVVDAPPVRASIEPGLVVVLCGGGRDAVELCRRVIAARRRVPHPNRIRLRVVTGPLADFDGAAAALALEPDVELRRLGTTTESVAGAAAVISRAGYNSAAALIGSDLPLVLLPVRGAGSDQQARAERLSAMAGVWCVHETADSAEAALASALWQAAALEHAPRARRAGDGARGAARWVLDAAGEAFADEARARVAS